MLRRSFVGLLAAAPFVRAQSALSAETAAEIEKLIAAAMAEQKLPAVSAAIAAPDGSLWTGAWGLADLEHSVRVSPQTVFRTASVAKPIMGVAAMLLAESGRLDLDADIRKWVPEFPEKQWPVTMRQLLAHLAGIRAYRDDLEIYSTQRFPTLAEAMAYFAADPLVHEPGTKYLYSSYAFVVAGLAAERAAGRPLIDYMQERVFAPLGMMSTQLDDSRAIILHRARGYTVNADGVLRNAPYLDTSGRWPGGGLVSTAADLVRFATGAPKLLKRASLDTMWTPQQTRDGSSIAYGLGWNLTPLDGHRQAWHTGGQSGFTSVLRYLPDDRLALAILINRQGAQHAALADAILRLVLGAGSAPSNSARTR
jgi:CubicO group peptidase (beta-lactamase class C family)